MRSNFRKFTFKKVARKNWMICSENKTGDGYFIVHYSVGQTQAKDICQILNNAYNSGREEMELELNRRAEDLMDKLGI